MATGVTVWDSGWYYCEVENDIEDPITLKHNLQVLGNSNGTCIKLIHYICRDQFFLVNKIYEIKSSYFDWWKSVMMILKEKVEYDIKNIRKVTHINKYK